MDDKEKDQLLGGIRGLACSAVIMAATFAEAFPLQKMWAWAVVPVFHAPLISYAQSWTLLALLAFLKYIHFPAKTDKSSVDRAAEALNLVFSAYVFMAIAWGLLRLA